MTAASKFLTVKSNRSFLPLDLAWGSTSPLYWADSPELGLFATANSWAEGDSVDSWPKNTREAVDSSSDINYAQMLSSQVFSKPGSTLPVWAPEVSELNGRSAVRFATNTASLYANRSVSSPPPYSMVFIGYSPTTDSTGFLMRATNTRGGGGGAQFILKNTSTGNTSLAYRDFGDVESYGGLNDSAVTLTAHLHVAVTSSLTTQELYVDNLSVVNGSLSLPANAYGYMNNNINLGAPEPPGYPGVTDVYVALAGFYLGDITSDPKWPDFLSWVTSYYNIPTSA